MTSLKNFDVYDCFFSGGRDSALTCYIAKKVGDSLNIPTRLIHVDTGIYIPQTREYVKEYANWLGAELKIRYSQVFILFDCILTINKWIKIYRGN